jgi:hypothetical protein
MLKMELSTGQCHVSSISSVHPGCSSHHALFIAKKKRSTATQGDAQSVAVEVVQDDTATEQNIRGKGILCVSKSKMFSEIN